MIPTVTTLKQQQDAIATLAELARPGIPLPKLKVVFNQVEDSDDVRKTFDIVLSFFDQRPVGQTSLECWLARRQRDLRAGQRLGQQPGGVRRRRHRLQGAHCPSQGHGRVGGPGAEARHPAPCRRRGARARRVLRGALISGKPVHRCQHGSCDHRPDRVDGRTHRRCYEAHRACRIVRNDDGSAFSKVVQSALVNIFLACLRSSLSSGDASRRPRTFLDAPTPAIPLTTRPGTR